MEDVNPPLISLPHDPPPYPQVIVREVLPLPQAHPPPRPGHRLNLRLVATVGSRFPQQDDIHADGDVVLKHPARLLLREHPDVLRGRLSRQKIPDPGRPALPVGRLPPPRREHHPHIPSLLEPVSDGACHKEGPQGRSPRLGCVLELGALEGGVPDDNPEATGHPEALEEVVLGDGVPLVDVETRPEDPAEPLDIDGVDLRRKEHPGDDVALTLVIIGDDGSEISHEALVRTNQEAPHAGGWIEKGGGWIPPDAIGDPIEDHVDEDKGGKDLAQILPLEMPGDEVIPEDLEDVGDPLFF